MAPFWGGIAIGLAVGIPILALCYLATFIGAIIWAINEGIRTGAWAAAWRAGSARAAPARLRREASRQRTLVWMEHHFGFRTVARLNRRLFD